MLMSSTPKGLAVSGLRYDQGLVILYAALIGQQREDCMFRQRGMGTSFAPADLLRHQKGGGGVLQG